MEREILFRGKTCNQYNENDNGIWLEAFLSQNMDAGRVYPVITDGLMVEMEVIPETVGQFTGLCDKNGVKIFEGDVINCSDFGLYEYSVVYENGCFNLYHYKGLGDGHGGQLRWGPISRLFELSDKAEVVGNIHGND